jgi:CRP/FNR family cyclic AMP-dependent transcriptional regulator
MNDAHAERHALIRMIPLFAALPEEEAVDLSHRAVERRYGANQPIFAVGDAGAEMLIIKRGRVKIFFPSEERGEEVVAAILEEGDFFGELAILDGQPRAASAVSLSDSELLCLHRDDFYAVLQEHPRAAFLVISVLSQRLRDADVRLAETAFLGVRERLAKRLWHLLEQEGEETAEGLRIRRSFSSLDLAHLIGATPERVQAELDRFQREMILSVEDGSITVSKPDDLQELAAGRAGGAGVITVPDWLLE